MLITSGSHRLAAMALALSASIPSLAVPGPAAAQEQEERVRPMHIRVAQYTDRPPVNEQTIAEGKRIYDRSCVFCHSPEGDGDGPVAYFLNRDLGPWPRDFTAGVFKFRSTHTGDLPTDEDLFRTVSRGVPGFMPPFRGLDPVDRWKVIYYVETFIPEDLKQFEPEVLGFVGQPVLSNAASIERGHKLYQELKCYECHGPGGKGNGSKAPTLVDDRGRRLPPRDLTRLSAYKAGSRPEDIYRTIVTGLDGGAMTSFQDVLQGRESEIWDLVNYILALSAQDR